MATEKLKFKLELYATMWDLAPNVQITIDGKMLYAGDIKGTYDKPDVIEIEHELDDGDHT